jgi:hypothetical protein
MCANIICENHGVCLSSYLSWSCECLDSSFYYGQYCEHKSSSLLAREILSRSFASIAIVAITGVFVFVITMDILKYVFKIDPIDSERRRLALEHGKKSKKSKTKRPKHKHRPFSMQFFHIS